jgi:glycosyltransferase involved in cell wall biosynthesis
MPMANEIVINGRFLSQRVSGVQRYARAILSSFGDGYRVEETRWNGAPGHAWEQLVLPTKMRRESVLWSPANTGPLLVRNQALTLHDVSPLEHPEWFKREFALWYRSFLPILIRRVRLIFTSSDFVRRKIEQGFGVKNVIVAPGGVSTFTFHPRAEQMIRGLPGRYVLFVGSLQPRKNLKLLLHAWRRIKDEFKDAWLLVAGDTGTVFSREEYPEVERVRFLGYVAEAALPGLYAHAACFMLPSHDEGFGLSALEAMACGTPVIVSNGGALPESVGDAGLVFDLKMADALPDTLMECLGNQHIRSLMIEKGLERAAQFSWERTAQLIRDSLHGL